MGDDDLLVVSQFQSTLSLRRATGYQFLCDWVAQFQSTLSLRRATFKIKIDSLLDADFNPRSPCGERL